jgi:serine/threonine protein kinase
MKHPYVRSNCRPQAGATFDAGSAQYVLHGKLGNGAVGIVRKATERGSGRVVAVKFLAPDPKYIEISAFDEVAERFRRGG